MPHRPPMWSCGEIRRARARAPARPWCQISQNTDTDFTSLKIVRSPLRLTKLSYGASGHPRWWCRSA